MKIAIDIDNTVLTQGHFELEYKDAVVKPDMLKFVNDLYDSGHEIYFYTARHFKFYLYTEQVLKSAGFKYHVLLLGKFPYDLLIDDRAVRFDNNKDDILKLIDGIKND